MRRRRTIASPVAFEGVGVHSGQKSSVMVMPLSSGSGICFRFGPDVFPITDARPGGAARSTSIVFPGGQTLGTVEHLLGALSGLCVDDALIEARAGDEFPILDGSALPYASALLGARIVEKDEAADRAALASPLFIGQGQSSIAAAPSDALRVTYVIDYPGTAIGTVLKDVAITPESFASDVAPARTFALLSEVESLKVSGLARGGDLANALVFGEDGPVGGAPFRLDGECAAHKILDLLGDLALAGSLPVAHYICIRGGHWLHQKLAVRMRALSRKK